MIATIAKLWHAARHGHATLNNDDILIHACIQVRRGGRGNIAVVPTDPRQIAFMVTGEKQDTLAFVKKLMVIAPHAPDLTVQKVMALINDTTVPGKEDWGALAHVELKDRLNAPG